MNRAKQQLKRIFFLPGLTTVLIALPAFLLVACVLAGGEHGPLAYFSYVVSAYALAISLTGCWRIALFFKRAIRSHPLGERLARDPKFRAEISLYQGFIVNLSYIAVKMTFGIYYRSPRFISLAVYYALLALMRLLLLFRKRHLDYLGELHRYRFCGLILLLMNLALAGIVDFIVRQDHGYEYPGTLIYAMAAYSFYAAITAIVNVVKFRKRGSPALSAAKGINLAAVMVSILSLETAMLSRFGGEDDPLFRKRMTGITGGAVCVTVLGMAVFMIVWSTKRIKQAGIQNH